MTKFYIAELGKSSSSVGKKRRGWTHHRGNPYIKEHAHDKALWKLRIEQEYDKDSMMELGDIEGVTTWLMK